MLGQVPDYPKPTSLVSGYLSVKVSRPYTDGSGNTTLSHYHAPVQIAGAVMRFIDQRTTARLTLPVQGDGDPTPPTAEFLEVLQFADGSESRNVYPPRPLIATAAGVFDYRIDVTAGYSRGFPLTVQQAQDVYEDLLPVLEQAQVALASLTDVTVTAETTKTLTLRFDSDPLASTGLNTTVATLQSSVLALDGRLDTAETDIILLDARQDATEASVLALDGRLDTAETDIDAMQALPPQTPIGTIMGWGKITPPTGWLVCNGQLLDRVAYAALFAVIGTSYGGGDGVTTFAVPDLRGRVPVGTGTGAGLTTRNLGQTGGAENHTLTRAELPDEGLEFQDGYFVENVSLAPAGITTRPAPEGKGLNAPTDTDNAIWQQTQTTEPLGNGDAHNNMPPFTVVQFVIKA